MANTFAKTPNIWRIDTASATPITTDWIAIRYMIWIAPAAVGGEQLVVTDAAGQVIWDPSAPGPNFESDEIHLPDKGNFIHGLVVPTLGTGHVLVILR